jgi:hypothetical protein
MWYWYLSGLISALLIVSSLINIGLITGYIHYHRRRPDRHLYSVQRPKLYNQDDPSGPIHRKAN